MSASATIAFASRFGTTARLAHQVNLGLTEGGVSPRMFNVAQTQGPPPAGALIVLCPVIWERPLSTMKQWLDTHRKIVRAQVVAAGVVCGQAGVQPNGGAGYAKKLARAVGNKRVFQFALCGRMPPPELLENWEIATLVVAATILRKPKLFELEPDDAGAFAVGREIAKRLLP